MAVSGLRFADLGRRAIQYKNVLIRVDFNGGKEPRLRASMASVRHARKLGAGRIFLLSHNGRPAELQRKLLKESRGQAQAEAQVRQELGMEEIRGQLSHIYHSNGVLSPGEPLWFVEDIRGRAVVDLAAQMPFGNIALLGNSRFYPGDVGNNYNLAQGVVNATGAEIVVEDGFSVLHRAGQASVGMIAKIVKANGGLATLGLAADQEIQGLLGDFVEKPARPYVGVFGGSKVSGKEGKLVILQNLLAKLDKTIIGGAMVFPFLVAEFGIEKAGEDPIAAIRKPGELDADIAAAVEIRRIYGEKIILPPAYLVKGTAGTEEIVHKGEGVPSGSAIRDLEPVVLAELLREVAADARTFIFNGAVGWTPQFSGGTNAVFRFMTGLTDRGAKTAIAGGDTNADAKRCQDGGIDVRVSVKPTGGGAFLKLLETGTLPIEEFLSAA